MTKFILYKFLTASWVGLALSILVLLPLRANAKGCDPDAFKTINTADLKIVQSFSYLRTITEKNYEERKRNTGGSIDLPSIPFFFKGSWDDFLKKRQELFDERSFKATYEDASSYLKAGLDKNGLAAYVACLKKGKDIRAWLEASSPTDEKVIVKIDVAAKGNPASLPVVIELSGLATGEQPEYQRLLANPGDTSITVKRNLSETFTAIVRIQKSNGTDISSDSLYIPVLHVDPIPVHKTALSYCIGHGGVEGLRLWGPSGEDCAFMRGKWGNYDQSPMKVTEICACKGHGGVEGVVSWGPKGQACWGIRSWGPYSEDCRPLTKGDFCACYGKGGVKEVGLWGPKNAYCGGLWLPAYTNACK